RVGIALGLVSVSVERDGSFSHGTHATPSLRLNAVEGSALYARMMDDMAAKGVTPLSAPPTQAMIRQYTENVVAQARRQAQIDHPGTSPAAQRARREAVTEAGRQASDAVMNGMQVHYRGASGNDPQYG